VTSQTAMTNGEPWRDYLPLAQWDSLNLTESEERAKTSMKVGGHVWIDREPEWI